MKIYKYSMRIYKYSIRIYKYSMRFIVPVVDQSDCSFSYNYDLYTFTVSMRLLSCIKAEHITPVESALYISTDFSSGSLDYGRITLAVSVFSRNVILEGISFNSFSLRIFFGGGGIKPRT